MKTIVGLMNTREEARSAIGELLDSGFQRDAIKVMVNDTEREQFLGEGEYAQGAAEESGARFGFLSGGTTPLTGMGVRQDDAEYYAEGVNRGGYLVTVSADDDSADEAAECLRRHGAIDMDERAESWRQQGWTGSRQTEASPGLATHERENVIPVVEEEIQVGKREVQKGTVRVYSRITETPVEEEIRLREEHAKIERRPVDRLASEAERDAFKERSFEVREMVEEPVVSKQARVTEEVTVGTEASERTEVVRDTLRRTDVEVEKMEGASGRPVSAMDDDEFERHFRATYGQRGERFEETYRSAYYFAEAESASHPQFVNKDWPEVEEEIHRDWERSHPGTWSRVQDAIHFGWDKNRRH